MPRIVVALALLAVCPPRLAVADSDGYFCTGRGYLAYETRFSQTPATHLLHVVRFGRESGIIASATVPLDDFQVHGMSCRAGLVELAGWTNIYSVDISDLTRPKAVSRPAALNPNEARPAANLGHWAKPQVIDLDADGVSGEFQLVIARVSRRVPPGIEHYTISHLIRRDSKQLPDQQIVASLKVFEGIFLETVDGNETVLSSNQRLHPTALGAIVKRRG